ncbi:mersacidin/lichenicidin family type 2 lantibiotic [Myxococcus stipitatus]|uniref:mersacidin/lichenicidin family type 2 lantibiotic n=1 Tax=Myxococcus stipitatus TaxID=83455 RepID=UPI001F425C71|nr:mersacidin/lichenicidin family type 2 lantibiotic [Myxococcus stipitatus]MCE9667129.1 mersacidin/lichenicidin family type 2 lantibiotic [Myxococcus stipitatus]
MSQSKKDHIRRAWSDPAYYESLTAEERAALPANPASELELDDDVLESITGGCCQPGQTTVICTPCPPKVCL